MDGDSSLVGALIVTTIGIFSGAFGWWEYFRQKNKSRFESPRHVVLTCYLVSLAVLCGFASLLLIVPAIIIEDFTVVLGLAGDNLVLISTGLFAGWHHLAGLVVMCWSIRLSRREKQRRNKERRNGDGASY